MQDVHTTFAGYTLYEAIGRDAVSTTYRATVPTRAANGNGSGLRAVAVQISEPLTDSLRDRRRAAAFQGKVAAAAQIEHPAVPLVLDAGAVGDRVFAVTAWHVSVTLDDLIGRRWQLTPDEAIALLRPLADGLDAAHAAGVVHGALGVRTIRVDDGGSSDRRHALATGFGLDELLALRMESREQRGDHALLDDVLYVAPEQLRGEQIDAAADQYALACALYHCVTGAPPFVRETMSALFGAHMFARPALDDALTSESTVALRDAIAVGLAKRPVDRHSSCAALMYAAQQRQVIEVPDPALAAAVSANGAADDRSETPIGPKYEEADETRVSGGVAALALSARETLRRLPRATVPVLALVAGLVTAILLFAALRDDGPVTASGDGEVAAPDGAAPANAVGEGRPDDEAAAQDVTPQAPPETAVQWDSAVDDAGVVSMAVRDGVVVVTTENGVFALDSGSGASRWPATLDVQDTPATVVTDDAIVYEDGGLHALSLDGRPLWSRTDDLAPDEALTFVPGGPLYGMGPGRVLPELTALDPATGEEQWHFHGEEDVRVKERASVAAADDVVTILQNGSLFALDPNGELGPSGEDRVEIEEELWRVDVQRPWRSSLTLLDAAVLYATKDGSVCSVARSDGAQQWCRRLGDVAGAEPTMLADSTAIVVAGRSRVGALEPSSGDIRWSVTTDAPITAAARHADTIVVADRAGDVRAIEVASGCQRWAVPDLGAVTSLSADGTTIYAGTAEGRVMRISPEGA